MGRSVNGSPAGFRIACAELSACAAGQRVQGWFTLQQPDMEEQTAQYADGIALQAEPLAESRSLPYWVRAVASVPAPTACSKN